MEKRFVAFLLAALCVMLTYNLLVQRFLPAPPKQVEEEQLAEKPDDAAEPAVGQADVVAEQPLEPNTDDQPPPDTNAEEQEPAAPTVETRRGPTDIPQQWFVLGSLDPSSPYRLMVVLTNRGAAVESVTLNGSQYKELNDSTMFLSGTGYLGGLVLSDDPDGNGCRVEVVAPGTPAAQAKTKSGSDQPVGLHGSTYVSNDQGVSLVNTSGDLITALDGQPVPSKAEFQRRMSTTRPGQSVELTVERGGETLVFSTTLVRRPLQVLRPEPLRIDDGVPRHPASYVMSLTQIGEKSAVFGQDEIPGLPSLKHEPWEAKSIDGPDGPGVEFRYLLSENDLAIIGQTGSIEVIKRYRLAAVPEQEQDNATYGAFHLTFELEIHNHDKQGRQIAYQMDGSTGLTEEGWWYSFKTGGSGARDVVWCTEGVSPAVFGCNKIVKQARKNPENPETFLFDTTQPSPTMHFAGTDAQYFAAILLRNPEAAGTPDDFQFASAVARPVADFDPISEQKRTDVSFRLTSRARVIPAGEAFRQSFQIYVGPKQTEILQHYGLQDIIVYGWFGVVSKFLLSVLHFFHDLVGNYGLAIIMLTVLVRACMFPISRKMALNARRMQELAPEMKKIADKYKNDMEKRTQAQRELYQKHNFNPFGGCLLMFLQLPIFIGLYRGLSVDILLRQAPLIPGISWCSNLAGPDKFYFWADVVPGFLSNPTGWLGPYLNVLPLVTCVLFLVQQKMFTPPATDDQQKMQQQVMQFMMLFMAVLFFKVASGLCIYFIASSLWGLTERMLLPKSKPPSDDQALPATDKASDVDVAALAAAKAKRKRQRRR